MLNGGKVGFNNLNSKLTAEYTPVNNKRIHTDGINQIRGCIYRGTLVISNKKYQKISRSLFKSYGL